MYSGFYLFASLKCVHKDGFTFGCSAIDLSRKPYGADDGSNEISESENYFIKQLYSSMAMA